MIPKLKQHSVVQKSYQCTYCKVKCRRPQDMRRHLLVHVEASFECDLCGNKFTRCDTLRRHKRDNCRNAQSITSHRTDESSSGDSNVLTNNRQSRQPGTSLLEAKVEPQNPRQPQRKSSDFVDNSLNSPSVNIPPIPLVRHASSPSVISGGVPLPILPENFVQFDPSWNHHRTQSAPAPSNPYHTLQRHLHSSSPIYQQFHSHRPQMNVDVYSGQCLQSPHLYPQHAPPYSPYPPYSPALVTSPLDSPLPLFEQKPQQQQVPSASPTFSECRGPSTSSYNYLPSTVTGDASSSCSNKSSEKTQHPSSIPSHKQPSESQESMPPLRDVLQLKIPAPKNDTKDQNDPILNSSPSIDGSSGGINSQKKPPLTPIEPNPACTRQRHPKKFDEYTR